MVKGETRFRDEWLDDERFSEWVTRGKRPNLVHCCVCKKDLDISTMGKQGLLSHMTKSGTHKARMEARKNCESLFKHFDVASSSNATSNAADVADHATSSQVTPASSETAQNVAQGPSTQIRVVGDDVTRTEILWTLRMVQHHESIRSIDDLGPTLRKMFAASPNPLTEQFSLGRTKASYVINFGLKPFIESELRVQVNESGQFYVIMFDEAMNRVAERTQMDFYIRFWDVNSSRVTTRYMDSSFLGTQASGDLLAAFKNKTSWLRGDRLLQISMDGPSVNWKFLNDLNNDRKSTGLIETVNIGSCGLHVVHGAFKTGHKTAGFVVHDVLRGAFSLLKMSPARRARYLEAAKSPLLPKKFCSVRWLENVKPADRLIEIYDDIRSFVLSFKTDPQSSSFAALKSGLQQPDMLAQLHFFKFVGEKIEPFLQTFQTGKPLAPYLAEKVDRIVRSLVRCFVKPEILNQCDTYEKLANLDLAKDENLLQVKKMTVGSGATQVVKSKLTDIQQLHFYNGCRKFLVAMVSKIYERSPLKYKLCRWMTALSPQLIELSPDIAATRFRQLAAFFYKGGFVTSSCADRAGDQFSDALNDPIFKDKVSKFSQDDDRLDDLYSVFLGSSAEFAEAFKVVKMVLTLSHGNAEVESGFSVNKDLLVENLHEESLVAQRHVYDYVKVSGGFFEVNIEKPMIKSVVASYSRYKRYLEDKRRVDQELKRKADGMEKQILLLNSEKAKRQKLIEDNNAQMATIEREIAQLKPAQTSSKKK